MTRKELRDLIFSKRSYLCTGLDPEISKLPAQYAKVPASILDFNKEIITACQDATVAWTLNTAFFEQYGAEGWEILEATCAALPGKSFKIADAKRGDIGNTSTMYARAFFERMDFDAVTVSPYMGEDSLRPFLEFKDKWIICLALTSNAGHRDFQLDTGSDGRRLYERVIETVAKYGSADNIMFVVGATRADEIARIRELIPEHFLLVPGVGAQGGSLEDVSRAGFNADCGLLINSSRGILYASNGEDFAHAAAAEAARLQGLMAGFFD